MNAVVELRRVVKRFGDFTALQDMDLQLAEGEILGLLGHNGAGKTTTMKLILGVIGASAGEVLLFGESPVGEHAQVLRRRMGYLPESVSFYGQLTGREVLDYFGRLKGVDRAERTALLERVGIAHAADRRVKTYSKGMRQRLGLAQALLGHPRLLLLDEPTAGLDPTATREFYEMLDELRRQGTTVLLSSHILPGIERHIDRAAILGGGRLLAAGSLDELSRKAHLPLTIQVRGRCSRDGWRQRFNAQGVQVREVNGTRLELKSPVANKMAVMRLLLDEPEVQDVEIITPTLDNLYAFYNQPAAHREESA
ncbi:MAG: ABC transporter ATP-binding protein [Pseudomonadota bacterium]